MLPRPVRLAALALLAALPLSAGEDAADLATRKARLVQEVRELRALETAGAAGTVLLAEISRTLPELLWLEEMTFRDGQIRTSGQAFNTNAIARFIENLDAVPAFDEPTLVDATENVGHSYSFVLTFRFFPILPEEEKVPASGLRAEVAALEREREELNRRLARREDVPSLLDELRALAQELDLGSSSFVEARGSARAAHVDVDLAATYHGLALLFDRLKGLSALVTLDELTIRQKPELAEGRTIAASFRLRIPLRSPAP